MTAPPTPPHTHTPIRSEHYSPVCSTFIYIHSIFINKIINLSTLFNIHQNQSVVYWAPGTNSLCLGKAGKRLVGDRTSSLFAGRFGKASQSVSKGIVWPIRIAMPSQIVPKGIVWPIRIAMSSSIKVLALFPFMVCRELFVTGRACAVSFCRLSSDGW